MQRFFAGYDHTFAYPARPTSHTKATPKQHTTDHTIHFVNMLSHFEQQVRNSPGFPTQKVTTMSLVQAALKNREAELPAPLANSNNPETNRQRLWLSRIPRDPEAEHRRQIPAIFDQVMSEALQLIDEDDFEGDSTGRQLNPSETQKEDHHLFSAP